MGTFYYGGAHGDTPVGFDVENTLLVHLQHVIVLKLRRHESFILTLSTIDQGREVREALWLNPAVPMRFVMDEWHDLVIDHDVLATMMSQANTVGGIVLTT